MGTDRRIELGEFEPEGLRVSGYCQVKVNEKKGLLSDLGWGKEAWIDGVVVGIGARRAWIDIGKKVIQKRLAFVRNV